MFVFLKKIFLRFSSTLPLLLALFGPCSCGMPNVDPKPQVEKCVSLVGEKGAQLCATSGRFIQNKNQEGSDVFQTSGEQTRGVLSDESLNDGGICFTYLGNVESVGNTGEEKQMKQLASGRLRQQIGLKVKAQDSCNVLYVMWRLFPKNQIVITKKINSGKTKHEECGNSGYKNLLVITPSREIKVGEKHSITVKIEKETILVEADFKKVATIEFDEDMKKLKGPLGLRTDNGAFSFQIGNSQNISKNCH